MSWDTSSLEAMELTAKGQEDGSCALKIRGEWLEVNWTGTGTRYLYRWGKNLVPRAVAQTVFDTRSAP